MAVQVAKPTLVLPLTIIKKENPRDRSELVQQLIVLSVLVAVPVAFSLFRQGRLIEMVSIPLFVTITATVNLYLPGYLSYELREDGVHLCSALRKRTIAYADIEMATVYADMPSLGWWAWWAYSASDYKVGIFPFGEVGLVDAVASHVDEAVVVLKLKKGRPVLFTPEDPERAVKLINSLRKA